MYICKYISYELFDAMKKLTKLNIDALKNENPVLSTIEERMITGGGSGDCLYYSLSYVTGYSIDSIRDTYALYLYKLNCGDMGSILCGGSLEGNALYKACVEMANSGVSSEHGLWINTDSIWDVMRVTNADSPRLLLITVMAKQKAIRSFWR